MLMSLSTRSMSGCSLRRVSASTPLCAKTKSKRFSRICRLKRCRISSSRSGSSSTTRILVDMIRPAGLAGGRLVGVHRRAAARQLDDELRETPAFGLDAQAPLVLPDDDVLADGEPEPGALTRGLGGEKRLEDLLDDLVGNAVAVV